MKKTKNNYPENESEDMLPEYDLPEKEGVRGKYYRAYQQGHTEKIQEADDEEFRTLGSDLRQALGDLALRIDHIGSTAVPGLAAKDIIDIQVTVLDLTPAVAQALSRVGYERIENIKQDHLPPGSDGPISDWTKWIFRPPPFGAPPTSTRALPGGLTNAMRSCSEISYALIRQQLRRMPR